MPSADRATGEAKPRAAAPAGRPGARLPKFARLSTTLAVCYLALFILVLSAITAAVYVSVERNARRVVSDELAAGAVVFDRTWQLRTGQLETGAVLLARDFGFRAAVATHDAPTIKSALMNLRRRMGWDLAFVIGADGEVLASDGADVAPKAVEAAREALDEGRAAGVLALPDGPYEAVAAPILAPTPIGQVVFANRLDRREMASLVRLSAIAFRPQILVLNPKGAWISGASDLSPAERSAAVAAMGGSVRLEPVRIGDSIQVVRPLPSLGAERAALLLRYPLSEALAPYRGLLGLVLVFAAGGLALVTIGSWLVAREVTRPIAALDAAAAQLARGEGGQVLVDGQDEIAALSVTFNRMAEDIRRREQALDQAREVAEEASRAKSDFLANMSHEIRTPLNGILGMAQVMTREAADPEHQAQLSVIRESGEGLLAVLNSILDLSKIEAGRLELEAGDFDLADTFEAAWRPYAAAAAQKGVSFEVRIAPEAEGAWRGDALRLRQVIANLASNAVKFTDAGAVTLSVRTEDGLIVEVSDTGVGVAPDKLAILFERFAQADTSSTRRFGGVGLGLSICRELIGLMNGRMWVESEPGRGSTFGFHVPLDRAPSRPAAAPEGDPAERALRILAAEDNPTNQLILTALLQPAEAEVTVVEDGRKAVEAFSSGSFDLVLMDIQMPHMNGVEATRAIRRIEADSGRPPVPILAVSANVMTHQVEDYYAAGMDGVVSKPIQAPVLFAEIARVLAAGSEADPEGARAHA